MTESQHDTGAGASSPSELQQEVSRLRAELARAQVIADSARRAKAAFLSNMSHEIYTPLNAVVGLAELLLDAASTPDQRELARSLKASGDHLTHLLGGILELSRIETSALELVREPFDLVRVLEQALDSVAPHAAAKGIELCLAGRAGAELRVVGDAGRLRQVVVHLLANAVEFSGAGDVVVRARVAARVGDEVSVECEVRDQGPGFEPEELPRLFEPIEQRPVGSGLGFGLRICAHLCRLMGGEIWAENDPAGGAVVRFRVRLGLEQAAQVEEVAVFVGRRVRVDTASPGLRTVLVEWLTRRGAQVTADAGEVVIADMGRPACTTSAAPVVALVPIGPGAVVGPPVVAVVSRPVHHDRLWAALQLALAPRPPVPGVSGVTEPATLRILVAEDNPFNQRVILGALKKLGHAADVVPDGREAVDAVAGRCYDLVLMDLMMPELDGLAATREIFARWPAERRPQIVAMTAQATDADRDACLAAGMAEFLTKPVDARRLAGVLRDCPRRCDEASA